MACICSSRAWALIVAAPRRCGGPRGRLARRRRRGPAGPKSGRRRPGAQCSPESPARSSAGVVSRSGLCNHSRGATHERRPAEPGALRAPLKALEKVLTRQMGQ
jgi:hypothetical protein